jgi:uncharacterized membrane protein
MVGKKHSETEYLLHKTYYYFIKLIDSKLSLVVYLYTFEGSIGNPNPYWRKGIPNVLTLCNSCEIMVYFRTSTLTIILHFKPYQLYCFNIFSCHFVDDKKHKVCISPK